MSEPEVTITKSRLRDAMAGVSVVGTEAVWNRLSEHFEPGRSYQDADGRHFKRLASNGDHPWLLLDGKERG